MFKTHKHYIVEMNLDMQSDLMPVPCVEWEFILKM